MRRRFDLTDFEWAVIEPLLPNNSRGVPRVDDRRVFACISMTPPVKRGANRSMGRSRGGLTTKIHARVDAEGLPIDLRLSEGQPADCRYAEDLLARLHAGTTLLCDRGYDTDAIRATANQAKAFANAFSSFLYRYRNPIERFFNRIKEARGIAMRCDNHADNYLTAIKLFSVRTWLKR
ncbi:MAG: IS5 family transposase [Martelella sp.]|uniref:IS5 family transposase n=1 Tax=Martelella sp. TaxID=1969699 RepID=UPI003242CB58